MYIIYADNLACGSRPAVISSDCRMNMFDSRHHSPCIPVWSTMPITVWVDNVWRSNWMKCKRIWIFYINYAMVLFYGLGICHRYMYCKHCSSGHHTNNLFPLTHRRVNSLRDSKAISAHNVNKWLSFFSSICARTNIRGENGVTMPMTSRYRAR